MEENSVPQNLGEVDALLSSIESPPQQEVAAPAPVEEPKTQAEIEYELTHKGIKQKFPVSKVLSFAQQGFDYNKKMHDFNVQRGLFDAEKAKTADQLKKYADIEQRLNRYKEVEEYQKKDPNWWNHVVTSYQQRQQEQGVIASPNNNTQPIAELIQKEVAPLKEYISSLQEEKKVLAKVQEDTELDTVVSSFKEENSQFDWTTLDQNGHDLEARILKHAMDMGLTKPNQFKAAARDFLYDESLKRAELKSKEELGKDIQKKTKLGLGPVKDKPTDKVTRVKDVRSKSWGEVGDEALKELGL